MQAYDTCKSHRHSVGAVVVFVVLAVGFFLEATPSAAAVLSDEPDSYQYSTEETNTAAAQDLAREFARLRPDGTLNRATPNFEKAQRVFKQMVSAADQTSRQAPALAWKLYVHAGPGEEAYSRAGGKIVLSEQYLDRYRLEDAELALLLGHEMAHAICEHERQQLSAILRKNAPQRLQVRDAMELLGVDFFEGRQDQVLLRLMEHIADREGLRLAARAGFNPTLAMQFFDKLERLERYGDIVLPTHDSPQLRRMNLQEEQQRLDLFPEVLQDLQVNCGG